MVGGPNSNGEYEDNKNSYSCTEPALDYNGCFALSIAGLYSRYGGNVNSADELIKNVSEIDESHEFGTWYKSEPIPPVTTVTTEPIVTTTITNITTTSVATTSNETYTTTVVTEVPPSETIPEGSYYGDANLDNSINISDVVALNMYLLDRSNNSMTIDAIANSDVARDNIINSDDSLLLMNYIAMIVKEEVLGK